MATPPVACKKCQKETVPIVSSNWCCLSICGKICGKGRGGKDKRGDIEKLEVLYFSSFIANSQWLSMTFCYDSPDC